jgi:FkbM family methyltransferase
LHFSGTLPHTARAAAYGGQITVAGPRRKLAFVLAAADHGTMIVSRLDYLMLNESQSIGVGIQILDNSWFDADEVSMVLSLLELRRKYFKDGVIAIDCGANVGVHTIEWAKRMTGWGSVLAIEAQERIYYALAGNIAINNCFNASAFHAAVSDRAGIMKMPRPNYLAAASYGSLELKQRANTEFIGQKIDYSEGYDVNMISIDGLKLPRIDFIKIDIEGMEMEALAGAAASVERHRPVMLIESIKTDRAALHDWLMKRNYMAFDIAINVLAVHQSDPTLSHVNKT